MSVIIVIEQLQKSTANCRSQLQKPTAKANSKSQLQTAEANCKSAGELRNEPQMQNGVGVYLRATVVVGLRPTMYM